MKRFLIPILCLFVNVSFSQNDNTTINDTVKYLNPVTVFSTKNTPGRMPKIKNNALFSGKKNWV